MSADHLMTDTHDALLAIQSIARIAQHEHDGRDDAERAVRRAEFAIAEANEAVETATAKLKDADARLATQAESLAACMARLTTAEQALADERRAHAAAPDAIETIHARRAYELVERSTPWDGLPADARVEWAMSVRYLLDHMDIGPNGCLVASTAKRGHFADIVSERDTALARVKELEVRDADWQRVTGAAHPVGVRVLDEAALTRAMMDDGKTSLWTAQPQAAVLFAALSAPIPPILPAQGAAASDEEIGAAYVEGLKGGGERSNVESIRAGRRAVYDLGVTYGAAGRPTLTAREGAGVDREAAAKALTDAWAQAALRKLNMTHTPEQWGAEMARHIRCATLRPTPATPPAVEGGFDPSLPRARRALCRALFGKDDGPATIEALAHLAIGRWPEHADEDATETARLTADVVEAAEKWRAVYVDARAAGRPESVRRQVLSEAVRALSAHRGKPAPAEQPARFVVVPAAEVNGRPAEWKRDEAIARGYADQYNRDGGVGFRALPRDTWSAACTHAVVDTAPSTPGPAEKAGEVKIGEMVEALVDLYLTKSGFLRDTLPPVLSRFVGRTVTP